ncbi:MAG: hypothetical protein AB7V13_03750 [Pseudorhodoplanes sp.]|uniref:hypothetical protein n=1 Tax=Pseudorhodoplanes sp. TaxID=1934341 RepID=UPI003D0BDDBF
MSAITVGSSAATLSAKVPVAKAPVAKANLAGNGLFARLWAAFVEARMRQAEREIALHRHLLPGQFQAAGERLAPRSEKELPFVR